MNTFLWFTLVVLVGCSSMQKQDQKISHHIITKAVASIHSVHNEKIAGTIAIEDLGKELKVTADLIGLPTNARLGFHIHEKGICIGPEYESAGGHFNPHNQPHGRPGVKQRHLGDMGNIETNLRGEARKVVLMPKKAEDDLSLVMGKSIIIHKDADDLKSQPTGDAGERLACGLLRPVE
jgi:Cu-Zn family superoxide dismutase